MTGPGRTLGILGGGQLGRFIALAARTLGLKTAALDPSASAPALQVVDIPLVGSLDVPAPAKRLAELSDVVTLEWELIPAAVLEEVAKIKPLHPSPSVLAVIQDRLTQKTFLTKNHFPQTEYGKVSSLDDLPNHPVVLKRRTHGYDGKGQVRITSPKNTPDAVALITKPCLWEAVVPFEKEISVILARDQNGQTSVYPIAENLHRNGILHATLAPADIPGDTAGQAVELARNIAETLGHVGVMTVEMFLLKDGTLLINEIAPRVHNSGHYTLEACQTSQFEQHVRAVCALPLGPTEAKGPAVMVNLLGDLWKNGQPQWEELDATPGLTRHLYGKSEARPGRKMGHYTVVGPSASAEWRRALSSIQQA